MQTLEITVIHAQGQEISMNLYVYGQLRQRQERSKRTHCAQHLVYGISCGKNRTKLAHVGL